MAFDGIVVSALMYELNKMLVGGRIEKVFQPEKDELRIFVHNGGEKHQLLISVNPNTPRLHIAKTKKQNPATPPMFCMLLRKYLSGHRIVSIARPGFERIIEIYFQVKTELGDTACYKLVMEIMGKHSNIILVQDDSNKIIDSIKHVNSEVSRLRQVLPGLNYAIPPSQDKYNPINLSVDEALRIFGQDIQEKPLHKVIAEKIAGVSYTSAKELVHRAGFHSDIYWNMLNNEQIQMLCKTINDTFKDISNNQYSPVLVMQNQELIEFSAIELSYYSSLENVYKDSISEILDLYYTTKEKQEKIKTGTSNLKKVINNNLDRTYKKLSLQNQALKEAKNSEIYKKYGELITANLYRITKGQQQIQVEDYYENSMQIYIPIEENLSPSQNAQKYFKKYTKAKRTFNETTIQLKSTNNEIEYLESLLDSLEKCTEVSDVDEIKQELTSEGYLKIRKTKGGKEVITSSPLHFKSSDNIDIFVGKNNRQNDYLTMKFADEKDIWLHVKDIPGSHVILRCIKGNLPQKTLIEAAQLAAYFSKAKNSSNVPVDYTLRKYVRKPRGAKPGYVIYDSQKTLYVKPAKDINQII